MVNKQCVYPTGKVLGGTCVIGDMVYIRGNKNDYDKWAEEGNTGWSYEEVLPYFKKTEQMQIPKQDRGYHGYSGELKINNTRPLPLNYDAFFGANLALGLEERDVNGKQEKGVTDVPWMIDFNKRLTGGRAFILPILKDRKNLKVSLHSFVTRVLFEGKKATGVEFIKEGKRYRATATKEVILSAGAINSPQILMLSGIGPKDELERLGINVRNDLPVGKYLKDHPVFIPLYVRTNNSAKNQTLYEQVEAYLQGKTPLTSVFSGGPLAFINTKKRDSKVPNSELLFINPPQSVPANTSVFYNLDTKHQEMFSAFNTFTDHLIYITNLVPKSFGSITLKSKSHVDFPIIDLAFYTDKDNEDIEIIYEGIQYVLNLVKTKPLRAVNATVVGVVPDCEGLKRSSERQYWMCAIKYLTASLFHPACTTRMGISTKNSVVDPTLKVHNMEQLRVVDAGSLPELVSGHTAAAVYMMAEKASDLIKEEHQAY